MANLVETVFSITEMTPYVSSCKTEVKSSDNSANEN